MPVRARAILLTLALVAGAFVAAAPVQAAAPKVAIIVGPTEITDSHYHPWAQELRDTAAAAGASVDLRYCPTPEQARAAANGANIIVYFGHGNGFPNPYWHEELTDSVNGWGLRDPAKTWSGSGCTDSVLRYYGEDYLVGRRSGFGWNGAITPAPGFVMVYSNACYAPGAGEARPAPAESVAVSRVANYSTPVLQLGGTYFATDLGSERLVDLLLRNQERSFGEIFRMGSGYDATALRSHGHPDVAGSQVWVQKTSSQWLGTDYWYAFAGDPNRTPAGISLPLPSNVHRFAGADRYATAAAVSAASFDPNVPVAFVATGTNFPDALTGGVAAARAGGPVLLVKPTAVPEPTAAELGRLKPQRIVVLGGAGSVSDDVAAALASFTSGGVSRLWGANRFETAAAISRASFPGGASIAYIATGRGFPDALAGIPSAALAGGPILLVERDSIPGATAAELARLHPSQIVILGGSGTVSDGVAGALAGYATSVTRQWGADRYATGVAISQATFSSASTVYVATGANFPDALAGGAAAGADGVPLLLVPGGTLPANVADELRRLGPERVVVLGGTGIVTDDVVRQIGAAIDSP